MNILTEYFIGLTLIFAQKSIFELTWLTLLVGTILVVLILLALKSFFRLLPQLFLGTTREFPEYILLPKADREWYRLASLILQRAEYTIGKEARTVVRKLPGITLDNDGVFESLGPVPFQGLLAVAAALRKRAGVLVLIPLMFNKDTRHILRFIPLFRS